MADLWEELSGEVWDDDFALSKFQKAARMAFHVLQPYLNRDPNEDVSLPTEYVWLLLRIDRFAQHPVDAGKELAAAKLVSEGVIDQVLYGDFDHLPKEQAQTIFRFECDETEKTYVTGRKERKLVKLARDKDQQVRLAAIAGLGKVGKDDGFNLLITTMADSDPKIRAASARALGELGNEHAVAHLTYHLGQESDKEVVAAIKSAITALHNVKE